MIAWPSGSYTIVRMSTVDVVQQSVVREILRGELTPGSWLRQDELAERLGVSKIPVREALQRLAAMRLLRFEANRGAVVPLLSTHDAEEIYALRRSLEPLLLERAFTKLSIVDFAEAELALTSDSLTHTESNWAFHRALYRASGWERGIAMVEILHASVAPYVLLYTKRLDGETSSDDEHHAMLDACRASDRKLAVRLLRRHLDGAAGALKQHLATPDR